MIISVLISLDQELSENVWFVWSKTSYCGDAGKNFVSDGHFCTSICPAQPKINICTNFKHCHHTITYLDCVMSKNCLDLQNQRLRNQVIKAASVMELKTTRLKNCWAKKILLPNWPSGTIFNNMRY